MKKGVVGVGLLTIACVCHGAPAEDAVAKGMDLVDGAIVCSSYDLAAWMYGQVNVARHAMRSLSPDDADRTR